ncbi:C2 family cysteine protease [Ancylobacter dichloromethanicus]
MPRIPVDPAKADGLLVYLPQAGAAPPPGTPHAHWDQAEFKDIHLPPPGADYRYVASTGPLFVNEPAFEDVRQGSIGDCYLLSAINALIRRKPKSIPDMIGADADHVHVRFHVPHAGATSPVIVRVQRTILHAVVKGQNVPLQQHKADWVYFIEKAYAFLRAYYLQPILQEDLVKLPNPPPPQPLPPPSLPPWPFQNVARPPVASADRRYACTYLEALASGVTHRAYEHLAGGTSDVISPAVTITGINGPVTMNTSVFRCELLRSMLDESYLSPLHKDWRPILGTFLTTAGKKTNYIMVPLPGATVAAPFFRRRGRDTRTHSHDLCQSPIGRGQVPGYNFQENRIYPGNETRRHRAPAQGYQKNRNKSLGSRLQAGEFRGCDRRFCRQLIPGEAGNRRICGLPARYFFQKIETGLKAASPAPISAAFAGTKRILGTESDWIVFRKKHRFGEERSRRGSRLPDRGYGDHKTGDDGRAERYPFSIHKKSME